MVDYISAQVADAPEMSELLRGILQQWGSSRSYAVSTILQNYVENPGRVACTIARDECGALLGFQSLFMAVAGNMYDVTPGWGVIGTYVDEASVGQGVGRGLFAESRLAAVSAGLRYVDATIASDNVRALGYYEAMGFRTYEAGDGCVRKKLSL